MLASSKSFTKTFLVASLFFLWGSTVHSEYVQLTRVGQIQLTVGQAFPDLLSFGPTRPDYGDEQMSRHCLGISAKPVMNTVPTSYGDSERLSISLKDGRRIVGDSLGYIHIVQNDREVAAFTMKPNAHGNQKRFREGLTAHSASIAGMRMIGNILISEGNDNITRFWNVNTQALLTEFTFVEEYCVIDNNTILLRNSQPPMIEKRNLTDYRQIWQNRNPSTLGTSKFKDIINNTLYTSSQGINIDTGRTVSYNRGLDLEFSPNNKYITLYGRENYSVPVRSAIADIFDLTGKQLGSIHDTIGQSSFSNSDILNLAFSPSGRYLTIAHSQIGKLVIETYIDSTKLAKYDIMTGKKVSGWYEEPCSQHSTSLPEPKSDIILMGFDGNQISYYSTNTNTFYDRSLPGDSAGYFQNGLAEIDGLNKVARLGANAISITPSPDSNALGRVKRVDCHYFIPYDNSAVPGASWDNYSPDYQSAFNNYYYLLTSSDKPEIRIFDVLKRTLSRGRGTPISSSIGFISRTILLAKAKTTNSLSAFKIGKDLTLNQIKIAGVNAASYTSAVLSPDRSYIAILEDGSYNIYRIKIVR